MTEPFKLDSLVTDRSVGYPPTALEFHIGISLAMDKPFRSWYGLIFSQQTARIELIPSSCRTNLS